MELKFSCLVHGKVRLIKSLKVFILKLKLCTFTQINILCNTNKDHCDFNKVEATVEIFGNLVIWKCDE